MLIYKISHKIVLGRNEAYITKLFTGKNRYFI